jgi:exonuclease SbcC
MILKEIVIRNFKSHSNTRIKFEKGINLIAGRNGAGKSSILEAILVALYGIRPPMRKDDLLQVGTSEYTIDLRFEMNGRDYRIIRRSSGNSELQGEFYLEGDRKINEWVERNISPFHVFTGAVYVRQGEIEAIISDESGREKIIRKITRIEDYENAWKNLGQVIRELKGEMDKYMEILKQKEDAERRFKEKVQEIEKYKVEIGDCQGKLEKLRIEHEKVLEEKRVFDEFKREMEKLKEQVLRLEGEIKGMKQRLEVLQSQKEELEVKSMEIREKYEKMISLNEKARLYMELEKIHKEISNAHKELDNKIKSLEIEKERSLNELRKCEEEKRNLENLNKEISELKSKFENLRPETQKWEQIKSKVERKAQIEKTLSEKGYSIEKIDQMFSVIQRARERDRGLKEAFSKVSMEKGSLLTEKRRLEEVIEKIRTVVGICPVCGRELTDAHRDELLKKFSMEMERLKNELLKVEEKERKLMEERKKVEELLGKQDVVLKYKQLADELRRISEDLRGFDVEKLKDASAEAERILSRIAFLEEAGKKSQKFAEKYEEALKKLKEIDNEILELKKQLRERVDERILNAGFGNIAELERALSELRSYYEDWMSLRSSEIELKEVEEKKKAVIAEIEKCESSLREQTKQYEKCVGEFKKLREGYDERRHLELEDLEKKISKEIAGLEERLQVLKNNLILLEKDRDYLQRQLEVIYESEKKAKAIENAIPELEKIREKFLSYRNKVAEAALKEVERYASEIFEEFTGGKYSGIKLKRVVEYGKERLRIFILHHGAERETSFLSGGELIALGIAFRLALSMFESGGRIPLLILDEPTPFLDEERRRKLVEIMTDYLRRIPQVIVVSHDEELKDAADRVINVEYRGGVSVVEA